MAGEGEEETVSLITPTPVEKAAMGPMIEGTGQDYNEYNTGDAFTCSNVSGAFTMTFTVAYLDDLFDHGYVQPDNDMNELTVTKGDRRKLSWVANSGIKFGPVDEPKTQEIALFDVVNMVDRVGGLDTFNNPAVWGSNGEVSITYQHHPNEAPVVYETELLTQLLPCIRYKVLKDNYGQLYDLSTKEDPDDVLAVPMSSSDYYPILASWYGFFSALQASNPNGYQVEIRNTATELTVSVYKDDAWVKIYRGPAVTGDYRVHLQAHWGSGVTLHNITLDD